MVTYASWLAELAAAPTRISHLVGDFESPHKHCYHALIGTQSTVVLSVLVVSTGRAILRELVDR